MSPLSLWERGGGEGRARFRVQDRVRDPNLNPNLQINQPSPNLPKGEEIASTRPPCATSSSPAASRCSLPIWFR